MSRKKTRTPKSLKKKHADEPDIDPQTAITDLKEEILDDVRALSQAKMRSVHGLIERGKELIELEKMVETTEVKGPAPKKAEPELTINDI